MNHRVTFLQYQQGVDDWGVPVEGWHPLITVWAQVEGLGGREYFAAQQTVDQSDHRIRTRYNKRLVAAHKAGPIRAQHDGRTLSVQSVADRDGKRRWLEITCREVLPWQDDQGA